jgi:hypothetical protein
MDRRSLETALKKKKKDSTRNGHDRLEEAMVLLIQNQASFLTRMADTDRRMAETDRATSERFARIERDMAAILRVLSEHSRLLERLPEAIRDKIGFQGHHAPEP